MDFILNGSAHGDVASKLMASNFDVNALRPYTHDDGRTYMTQNVGGVPTPVLVTNAPTSLRFYDWKILDTAVLTAARQRLGAVAKLREAGLVFNIPNGMSKTQFEYEAMSDPGEATISMDGVRQSNTDAPLFDLRSLPLPIIHSDFSFNARQLMASRNGSTPLDTTMAEAAGRRVAEQVERLALGMLASYSFGGGTVYGMTNFPSRMTKAMTTPTGSNQATVVSEILAMRQQSIAAAHYGPWLLLNSPNWDQWLDTDYSASKGDNTLRDRIKNIAGITDMITCDFLGTASYQMIMVQLTNDVIRMVNGLDFSTVQWESKGGLQVNFKVMTIQVPQLRTDYNGTTGIVHGSAAA